MVWPRHGPSRQPWTESGALHLATIGILAQRNLHQAELLTTRLQTALNSRVIIEQAKGVLAERHQITVDQAFVLPREYSRSRNRLLSDVARDVAVGELLADRDAATLTDAD
jgi:AmiR/NasT family two-component response regulator